MPQLFRVTFVCSGNICRSPMGEVILRRLAQGAGMAGLVEVDSFGTGGWHEGQPAHRPTLTALRHHGYDGSAHRARQVTSDLFETHDLVLAADEGHVRQLQRLARTPGHRAALRLMREFDPSAVAAGTLEVDDPYYGDAADYERCLQEVEAACRGLLTHLRSTVVPGS